MPFEPIAVVARSCILPGALTPEALWANVAAGRSAIAAAPEGRWRLAPAHALAAPGRGPEDAPDRTWSDAGGYVSGFEQVFDPAGFGLPAEEVLALDPLFQWVLHGVREALLAVGHERASARAGLVLGNLSFPAASMARFAESVWLDAQGPGFLGGGARERAGLRRPDPRNRFMSGLPAHLAARALGLGGGAFALDAACASSLYALKLACDRLHDHTADLMVAGAVNCADDLFIHVGFCALSAMSRTGRSRPFHREADGLVPAEGAGFVVLKRLEDAVAAGDRIHGVLRGIGLSNDGRGRGLLAPSEEGQARAIRLAFEGSGLVPGDVSLVECHATGTVVGDATELRSLSEAYAGVADLPLGSLKSNLGHPITAAGVAGLIKVLAAMEAGVRPPTLHAEAPIDALRGTPFRLLGAAEPWTTKGPRRAAVSAFGFGGNNAHVLVEQFQPEAWKSRTVVQSAVAPTAPAPAVAIVGVGARVGDGECVRDFADALFSGAARAGARDTVSAALEGLRFPPRDLEQALPQQVLVLEAAREAAAGLSLPRERTAVLIGMGCDPAVARYGMRWRLADWAEAWGADGNGAWLQAARDSVLPRLEAAGVLGTMPNIPANRINSQLDLAGPSFTLSSEELSGVTALEVAARALRAGEIDAAIVGAVDLSCETVHQAALAGVGRESSPADAAVVLVLRRLEDARRLGDQVFAVVEPGAGGEAVAATGLAGSAHAASGLLQAAAAALALRHGARLADGRPAAPWFGPRTASVSVASFSGASASVRLRADGRAAPALIEPPPGLFVYSGSNRADLLRAMRAGHASPAEGPARLVLVAATDEELARRRESALRFLAEGGSLPEGVAFREAPIGGDLAFVFTGAAAAYAGMGRELALALPDLTERLAGRFGGLETATAWVYGRASERAGGPRHPLEQLWGCSYFCQLHAELTRGVLGLAANAAIGYSSGESNSLFAFGVWTDLEAMIRDCNSSPVFTRELAGEFAAVARSRRKAGVESPAGAWETWSVSAPVAAVRDALASEPRVRLTIVNAADDCVIAGESREIGRVLDRLGRERAVPLGYPLVAHCPEVEEVRQEWIALHRRPTTDVPGVRFYTNATGASYRPTSAAAAEAITGQAVHTLDFPRVIEQAYADGVRVFVEHGPRASCSGWIDRTLGDREHLALPLDRFGKSPVRQAVQAVAWLVAAGVPVRHDAFLERLRAARPEPRPSGPMLRLPAHRKPIRLPALPAPAPVVVSRIAPAEVVARAGAAHAHIAAVHREFVTTQAAVHQRFLDLRSRLLGDLTAAYRSPAPAAAPPSPSHRMATPLPVAPAAPPSLIPRGLAASTPAAPLAPSAPPSISNQQSAISNPPGPRFSRADLEHLASGRISTLFGPLFEPQDGYLRQCRMPEPPLLLADRVMGIDGVAGSMKLGTVWTETDVRSDGWYLHVGRMPAGVMIEAGQADLLLISWLGVDLLNHGERVYRLLGCELTYHGGLPRPGDTLAYDIHVDGHAQQGDVRLFFFHYDCRVNGAPRLTVRHGQAGFFTELELAESGGVLWDAATAEHARDPRLDPPAVRCGKRSFTPEEVRAFADGRAFDCFGPGFEYAQPHVRTPRIQAGRMLFLHRVTEFSTDGGPWGRGYLRAETPVAPDDWFFAGHFKNDPCMPGTLMFEGCLQAMAFYLAGSGYTLERDGWRFEPVPGIPYAMRCRGQVIPSSKLLTYEVFVEEVLSGPEPTLYADLLCTVDGLKAFHARRVGLRLIPDWPLAVWKEAPVAPAPRVHGGDGNLALAPFGGLRGYVETKPVAAADGFAFDYASLLSCAWGKPSEAFGPMYAPFDGTRKVARLPGPPYHFMTRVLHADPPIGAMKTGCRLELEFDVPREVWFFDENDSPHMPFCVLMEAALQPCGWLASYVGSARTTEVDLMFRNLDGTGTVLRELGPDTGTLRTKVKLLSISQSAGMIIESFAVECFVGEERVYEMNTVFGFFPKEAFENQVGLPATPDERARLARPSSVRIDLSSRPPRFCGGSPRLANPMLLMLDRITAHEPAGGRAGLGWWRAEKDVDPGEWFFKAHFYQDPVQPGSLGIEALLQLLEFVMLERGMGEGVENARFESVAVGRPIIWKYRGQVVPKNKVITTELELTEVGEDERGRFAVADGWLWVDGKRIYSAKGMTIRIVAGEAAAGEAAPRTDVLEETLDPAVDAWLLDHCPTWTLPALPMMSMVDRLAAAAQVHTGERAVELLDVQARRWLVFPGGPVRLRTEVTGGADDAAGERGVEVVLSAWREGREPTLSRFEPVATGRVRCAASWDAARAAWPALSEAESEAVADPYASGALFHGQSFKLVRSLRMGPRGASAILDARPYGVPIGALHQALLDGATHAIPHDELWRWSPDIPRDQVGYPHRIARLRLFAAAPTTGEVRVEVRFGGFEGDARFPAFDIQGIAEGRVWAELRLIEALFPKGTIGTAPREARRAFLRDRRYVPGVGLSSESAGITRLSAADVRQTDWLPGNVARIYALALPAGGAAVAEEVAIKEHVARRAFVHPATIDVAADRAGAVASVRPLRRHPVRVARDGDVVTVADDGPSVMELSPLRDHWRSWFGLGAWPAEDLYFGLIERFVRDVVISDPAAFAAVRGRSCLYVANHQVGIESVLFSVIVSALSKASTVTLAKAEHRTSWLGRLIQLSFSYPGAKDPRVITHFEREDREALMRIVAELGAEMRAGGRSVMVHVEGTRSLSCRTPVVRMSSAFIDMALGVGAPIVPVRFVGGLPVAELPARLEFPVGGGRQDYWLGRPIHPEALKALPLKDRKQVVLDAINGLGPRHAEESPSPPDPSFEAKVNAWVARTGATPEHATLWSVLDELPAPGSEETRRLVAGGRAGRLEVPADAPGRWLAELARRLFGEHPVEGAPGDEEVFGRNGDWEKYNTYGTEKARIKGKRPRKNNCADSDLAAPGGAALWAALRGPEARAPRHRSIHENVK
ncbi:MAG: polyketide synthase dehydratase domain-containing protein [Planctomycetes bacterium]|nr:polyketide synthase dehydratase domain-containing protein [Planctomycetota bacterium]